MNAAPDPCADREALLHALADGEIDAINALAAEKHLRECAGCAAAFKAISKQKALLAEKAARFQAPPALRARALSALAEENSAREVKVTATPASEEAPTRRVIPFGRAQLAAAFSALVLAASLVLFVNVQSSSPGLDQQLVSSHVRSLLASHLTDVASSDQHTVKPWFLGKLHFAPPVVDLAKEDFPLMGGRLDYIGGRVTPSLVYRRRGHVINLFVWPKGQMSAASTTVDGYHVLSFREAGFDFAAVSDLGPADLRAFATAFANELNL
jgi:anti-sigma factor RsiW